MVKDHPEHEFIVHQTEVSRGPVRKAQYHWGCDWGPTLMTYGLWRPVRIEVYESRIGEIAVKYNVNLSEGERSRRWRLGCGLGLLGGQGGQRWKLALRGEQWLLSQENRGS